MLSLKVRDKKKILLFSSLMIGLALLSPTVIAMGREYFLEQELRHHFHNWESDEYINWKCADKSEAVEEYLENIQYKVINIYGHGQGDVYHRWLIIEINGVWKEFECGIFKFQKTSVNYNMLAGTCTPPMEVQ